MSDKLVTEFRKDGEGREIFFVAHGPLYPNFHKRVKALASAKSKSMTDLAKYFGIKRQSMYGHLKAKKPSHYVVPILAEYFETTVDQVLGDPAALNNYKRPFRTPVFNVFKNRILLNAERQGIKIDELSKKINLTEEIFLARLEDLERNTDPLLADESNERFVKELLAILNKDFAEFFFMKPSASIEFEADKIKKKRIEELSQIPLSVEEWLEALQDNIVGRNSILKTIIHYYTRRYPQDPMSKYLLKLTRLDDFGLNSDEYENIINIMRLGGMEE